MIYFLILFKYFIQMKNYFKKNTLLIIQDEKAQSLAEYSIILIGIMGLFMTASFDLFPRFIRAFQLYFDSYYIMLNLPIP